MKIGDPKKKPIKKSKLIKECDDLVSKIVRLRDKQCVCCGSRENLTDGHLITRACKIIRWDLTNNNCQCRGCNYLHEFRHERYTKWWIDRYGKDAYDELVALSWQTKNWKIPELIEKKLELEAMLQKMIELDKLSEL